jgi:hypothetical protein
MGHREAVLVVGGWHEAPDRPACRTARQGTREGRKTPAKTAKPEGRNLTARLRELIKDKRRLDNAAIWAIVQPEFDLANDKRGYVAGQRRHMLKLKTI